MYICPNCNKKSENAINFCPDCGTAMISAPVEVNEIPEQPQYAQPFAPQYSEQQYGAPPAPQQPIYNQYVNNSAPVQPQYPQQQYNQPYGQPTYNQPVYYQPEAPSKAKAITGMALSAAGLLFAVMGFFDTLMSMGFDGAYALGMSIGFGIFSLPLSLVGLIMSSKARSNGDMSIFTKLGKIFGLVGTILSGVTILFGIIGAAAGEEAYLNDYDDFHDYY